jgi:hypothetical protein
MSSGRQTLCLLIDRRSSLALVLLWLVTYSNDAALVLGGAVCTAATYSYLSSSAAGLEERMHAMQRTAHELKQDLAMTQQEINFLQQRLRQRHLLPETTSTPLQEAGHAFGIDKAWE